MLQARSLLLAALWIFSISAWAQEPDVIRAVLIKPRPYEVSTGTVIQLVMRNADPGEGGLVSAMVSYDIYDRYENITIPRGSVLVGHVGRRVNDREIILWSELQIAGDNSPTIELTPPLNATMPDGSSGVLVSFKHGSRAATIVGLDNSFVIFH